MPQPQRPTSWSSEIQDHLRAFVSNFVAPQHRPRWKHILLERRDKARMELHRFDQHNDSRTCKLIESVEWESLLNGQLAEIVGVYFDGRGIPELLTGTEVEQKLSPYVDDAIFSVVPGAHALFISHDGHAWQCFR